MWICLNDAFFSIVCIPDDPTKLKVRARFEGDIEEVFGSDVKVIKTPQRDYLYRSFIDRDTVASVLASRVKGIDYPNFKSSVLDDDKHDAYSNVWGAMWDAQSKAELQKFGGRRGR